MIDSFWATAVPALALGLALHRTANLFALKGQDTRVLSLILAIGMSGICMVWCATALSHVFSLGGITDEYIQIAQRQGPALLLSVVLMLYGPEGLHRMGRGVHGMLRALVLRLKGRQ